MGILFIIFLPVLLLMILECEELAGKVLVKTLKIILACASLVMIYVFKDFFIGFLIFFSLTGALICVGKTLGLSED